VIPTPALPRTEADIQASVRAAMESLNPTARLPEPQPIQPIQLAVEPPVWETPNHTEHTVSDLDFFNDQDAILLDEMAAHSARLEKEAAQTTQAQSLTLVIPQPDDNGQFNTPADGSKYFASLGIPQIPLRPKTKVAQETDWPNKTSLDFSQIDKWTLEYPGCNFASVAKATLDGFFCVEVDSTDVQKRIKAATGEGFTSKAIVVSSKGGHRWYQHSEESLKQLDNTAQGYVVGADFSVRCDDQYALTPGSIHPSGKQYRLSKSFVKPTAITQRQITWINSQKVTPAKKEIVKNAAGLVPHGSIHSFMLLTAGRMRHAGLTPDEIEPALLRKVHNECQGPIDDTKVIQMARSIGNYEEGNAAKEMVLFGGSDANTEIEIDTEEIQDEPLPDFPRFTGSLAELSETICPDIPREFKLMAAITHWGLLRSGLDTLESEHLQPRFYCCFIKEPGWGKTAAINEVRKFMQMITSRYSVMSSIDSGPALVDEFKEVAGNMLMTDGTTAARVLLDVDEMRDLFEKSKVTPQSRNSMFAEMLKLFEGNRTGNRSRKAGKSTCDDAHLSILGGATPQGYESMWTGTGGGTTGLQSRFVLITTSAGKMPIQKVPTDMNKMAEILERIRKQAEQPGQVVSLTPEANEMLANWWSLTARDKASEFRIDDMVKRLVIVLAVTNDTTVVSRDLMHTAIQFGDYLIAAREKFNPDDSYSWCQAFEQIIEKVAKKHRVAMTMNDYRRIISPAKRPGGLGPFLMAWKNTVTVGTLRPDGKTIHGTIKYRL
jgi:hypothetical protein